MRSSRRSETWSIALSLTAPLVLALAAAAGASSHREAPLITEDPVADNTDTYAFVDPKDASKVILIANWIPLEEPAGGPNFFKFGDEVRYDINVDNDGDAKPEIVYEFRFKTRIGTRSTFLYNTGPITSLDDPDFNLKQTYRVRRRGRDEATLGEDLLTPPVNIGPRSTPDYEALAALAVHTLPGGIKVFAGQRAEAFAVDLGSIFDLAGLRPFNPAHLIPLAAEPGLNMTSGYNVHTIALQVPKAELVDRDPVIGVWSSTYRREVRVFDDEEGDDLEHEGDWVQVSRLGMPLVNEIVIPLRRKDRFNASEPEDDVQFLGFVLDPEPARLIPVLYPNVFTCFPTAPRSDLVTIFLTGIEGLNQPRKVRPAEMIRLNTEVAPTPLGQRDRLGLLAGQLDGFPNGRRLEDDVVDIELRALAGATPLGSCANESPNNLLGDGVDAPDVPFLEDFPYMPTPHQGYDHAHDHSNP